MLRQLRASGALQGVSGVVFGDMKGCAPGFHEDYTLEEVLLEALAGLDVPVALGLSSGHTAHPNVTLPLGVPARLECSGGEARFAVLEAPVE
jgi:muramoyltetrapeptide carboxypeptidase